MYTYYNIEHYTCTRTITLNKKHYTCIIALHITRNTKQCWKTSLSVLGLSRALSLISPLLFGGLISPRQSTQSASKLIQPPDSDFSLILIETTR